MDNKNKKINWGAIIAWSIILIVLILVMRSCLLESGISSNDGRCDFCGKKTTNKNGGYEVCWNCYNKAVKKQYDNYYNNLK